MLSFHFLTISQENFVAMACDLLPINEPNELQNELEVPRHEEVGVVNLVGIMAVNFLFQPGN